MIIIAQYRVRLLKLQKLYFILTLFQIGKLFFCLQVNVPILKFLKSDSKFFILYSLFLAF